MNLSDSDTDTEPIKVDHGRFEVMINMFKSGIAKDNPKQISRIINKRETRMSDLARDKFKTLWTAISEFRNMFNNRDAEVRQSLPYQETIIEVLHMQGQQTGAWKLVCTELINPYTGKVMIDGWAVHGLSQKECSFFHDRADRITKKLRVKFEEANPRLSEDDEDKDENGENGKDENGKDTVQKEDHREDNDGFDDDDGYTNDDFLDAMGESCEVLNSGPTDGAQEAGSKPTPVDLEPNLTQKPPLTSNDLSLTSNDPVSKQPETEKYGPYHPLTLQKEAKEQKEREEIERERELAELLDYEIKSPQWDPRSWTPVSLSPPSELPQLELIPTTPNPTQPQRLTEPKIPVRQTGDQIRPNSTKARPGRDQTLEITFSPMTKSNTHRDDLRAHRDRTQQQRKQLEEVKKRNFGGPRYSPMVQQARDRMRGCEKILEQSTTNTRNRELEGARDWSRNRNFSEKDPYKNFRRKSHHREDNSNFVRRNRALTSPAAFSYNHDHRYRHENTRRSFDFRRGPRQQVNRVPVSPHQFLRIPGTPNRISGASTPGKRRQKYTPPLPKRARSSEVETLRVINTALESTLRQMTAQFQNAIETFGSATRTLNTKGNKGPKTSRLSFSP